VRAVRIGARCASASAGAAQTPPRRSSKPCNAELQSVPPALLVPPAAGAAPAAPLPRHRPIAIRRAQSARCPPRWTRSRLAADVPFKPQPGGQLVKFNLQDADLAELVNHISGLTGKRFIYGAKVRQIKATVVSPERSR